MSMKQLSRLLKKQRGDGTGIGRQPAMFVDLVLGLNVAANVASRNFKTWKKRGLTSPRAAYGHLLTYHQQFVSAMIV